MLTRLATFENGVLLAIWLLRLHECTQVTREDISESPETSKNFSHLGLQECSHGTRGDILGTTQDFKGRHDEGTSQDMSGYVRNTLTSDGSPRYLRQLYSAARLRKREIMALNPSCTNGEELL